MSLRWRKDGTLWCAAKTQEEYGDCYIDDRLHYELSVIQKTIVPSYNEQTTGEWFWVHGWCNTVEHPEDVRRGCFARAEAREEEEILSIYRGFRVVKNKNVPEGEVWVRKVDLVHGHENHACSVGCPSYSNNHSINVDGSCNQGCC